MLTQPGDLRVEGLVEHDGERQLEQHDGERQAAHGAVGVARHEQQHDHAEDGQEQDQVQHGGLRHGRSSTTAVRRCR